jgi:hypothetical protein
MPERSSGPAVVIEKLREFDRVATLLDMPKAERLNILNVSDYVYTTLCRPGPPQLQEVRPELERRLSYALPLMRRLASNSPALRSPPARAPFSVKMTDPSCFTR